MDSNNILCSRLKTIINTNKTEDDFPYVLLENCKFLCKTISDNLTTSDNFNNEDNMKKINQYFVNSCCITKTLYKEAVKFTSDNQYFEELNRAIFCIINTACQ